MPSGTPGTSRQPVAPTMLLWGDPVTDPPDAVGSLQVFTLVEDHERDALVTEHTVEQGSNVVDHVRPEPQELSLQIFVTQSPIQSTDGTVQPITLELGTPGSGSLLEGGTSALISKGLNAIGIGKSTPTQVTASTLQFNGQTDYVKSMMDTLTLLQTTATLLKIFTPRQPAYENMVIKKIAMHRDSSTGTGATFTVDFRQIRIVASKVVDAPLPSIVRAKPTNALGKKDTAATTGPKESNFVHEGKANGALTGTHFTGIPTS